jgi:hypothetical protein
MYGYVWLKIKSSIYIYAFLYEKISKEKIDKSYTENLYLLSRLNTHTVRIFSHVCSPKVT